MASWITPRVVNSCSGCTFRGELQIQSISMPLHFGKFKYAQDMDLQWLKAQGQLEGWLHHVDTKSRRPYEKRNYLVVKALATSAIQKVCVHRTNGSLN